MEIPVWDLQCQQFKQKHTCVHIIKNLSFTFFFTSLGKLFCAPPLDPVLEIIAGTVSATKRRIAECMKNQKNICSNILETKKRTETVPNIPLRQSYAVKKGTINVMLFLTYCTVIVHMILDERWGELHVEVSLSKILNPKLLLMCSRDLAWQPLPTVRALRWTGNLSRVYSAFAQRQLGLAPAKTPRPLEKRIKQLQIRTWQISHLLL